jgi:hypothetical protein
MSRLGRARFSHLRENLFGGFIQANLRTLRVIGAMIDLQDILHRADKGGILIWWDAPHLLEPRLQRVFFIVR